MRMKTHLNKLIFFVLLFLFLAFSVHAISEENVKYPVAELGNCSNKAECHAYCEKPDNLTACLDFAEKNGLMEKEKIQEGRKFERIIKTSGGPGGCKDRIACEAYCEERNSGRIAHRLLCVLQPRLN